jgi:hypothetical protein
MLDTAKLIPLIMPVLESSAGYSSKVLGTARANLLAYWPLGEATGSVAEDISGNSFDGSYTGVTLGQTGIGDGNTCPLFDGANDFVDIYSTGFRDAFNAAEGSAMIWGKVFNAGVWTDSTDRRALELQADPSNRIEVYKSTSNDKVAFRYEAAGTDEVQSFAFGDVDWFHVAVTWSVLADEVIYYKDGSNLVTRTGLGTWAGALSSVLTVIGASRNNANDPWYGYLAHCAVWSTPLTPTQILALATV